MKLNEIFQAENLKFTNKNMGRMLLKSDYKMDAHSHNRIEIMLFISDEIEVIFFDKYNKQVESVFIKKGQFIIIDENVKHDIRVLSDDTEELNLEFTISPCPANIGSINKKGYLAQLQFFKNFCTKLQGYAVAADTINLKETIIKIHDTYFESTINQEIMYLNDLLLLSFLIDVARCQLPEKSTTNNYHVNKAVRLLNLNIAKNITTDFLADKIGINKSYLQRIFKEQTGKTIISYLNELRIKQAKKLLANKNFAIIDVAVEVGFNNRQNFAVAFKKLTGTTPSEYRQQVLKKEYNTYYN